LQRLVTASRAAISCAGPVQALPMWLPPVTRQHIRSRKVALCNMQATLAAIFAKSPSRGRDFHHESTWPFMQAVQRLLAQKTKAALGRMP
jgi:hypothetical protein